jgi:outer membrane protein
MGEIMNYKSIFITGGVLLFSSTSASSVEIKHGNIYTESNTWLIGSGLTYGEEFYKDTDDEWTPLFDFGYLGEDLSLSSSGLGYQFYQGKSIPLNLSVKLHLSHSGYEPSDSDFLNGMQERDPSYDASIIGDFHTSWGVTSLYLSHDITNSYDSFNFGASQFFPIDLGQFTITPSLSAHYFSKKFNQYYFGVESNESNVNRTRYSPNSDFVLDFSYYLSYQFSKNWQLINSTTFVYYGSEITDSPIVSTEHQIYSSIGAYYYF